MRQSQLTYLNSISQSISTINLRELNDCIEFDKLIRFEVFVKNIKDFENQVHQLGLNYSISETSFKVVIDKAMNDWSSSIENCLDTDANAMRFVYLHKEKKICYDAKLLDSNENDLQLGLLLQYPKCCVEAYLKWQHDNDDIDPITTITSSFSFTGRLQNFEFPNPFSRYFSSGLFSHFPCSLYCKATSKAAQASLDNLQKNFPVIADRILSLENSFVIFHKDKGVCLWTKFTTTNDKISFDKVSFNGQRELKSIFETVDSIEISKLELKLFSNLYDMTIFTTDGCFVGLFKNTANAQKNTHIKTTNANT